MRKILRLGTRQSDLAVWQANWVRDQIRARFPHLDVELVKIDTQGDKTLDVALQQVGDKGFFTFEIDTRLRAGDIDLAVHSLKDLPTALPEGLALAAICHRQWVHDVLAAKNHFTLATLPSGARVGTCSVRRTAQVKAFRRDLKILPLRGNVPSRLRKLQNGEYEAIILAEAGVRRLGLDAHISEVLATDLMLPAPAQGALGIEIRADNEALTKLLLPLNDPAAQQETVCERTVLKHLGAGCQVPVAALARAVNNEITCWALVASVDGQIIIRERLSGAARSAEEMGRLLADRLLARGAEKILAEVRCANSSEAE